MEIEVVFIVLNEANWKFARAMFSFAEIILLNQGNEAKSFGFKNSFIIQ